MGTDRFTLDPAMDVVRAVRDEMREMMSRVKEEIRKEVLEAVKGVRDEMRAALASHTDSVRDMVDGSMGRLEKIIVALPRPEIRVDVPLIEPKAPVVNVQPASIEFRPDVKVSVPQAKAPVVHVNVPKQERPHVEVNVPQGRAPEIKVEVPRRKVKKHITYDEAGRPVTVEEEEA